MPRNRERTTNPVSQELRSLLEQHGVSMRALADAIGVNQSYLVRILGPRGAETTRRASPAVAAAIAECFGLPSDYFPEYREAVVQEALIADPAMRDRIYDSLLRRRR